MAIIQPYHANLYAHVKALKHQASAHEIKATTQHTLVLFANAILVFMVACVFVFICTPTPPTHQRVGNIRFCASPRVNHTIPNVLFLYCGARNVACVVFLYECSQTLWLCAFVFGCYFLLPFYFVR